MRSLERENSHLAYRLTLGASYLREHVHRCWNKDKLFFTYIFKMGVRLTRILRFQQLLLQVLARHFPSSVLEMYV